MANLKGHLIAGTIAGVSLAFLLSFFGVNPAMLFIGAVLCIGAAMFPDIDQENSTPRNIMRGIVPGLVGLIALYLYFSWRYWNNSLLEQALFIAFPFVFLLVYEKFMPRHRGAIHKFPGLLMVSGAVIVLGLFLGYNPLGIGVLVLFSVLGFSSHVIMDHI
ncbi:MAG: metal-dependent hydrolase [Candidatus Nanoarchaeia archaeon]|nr:metal-dependent hydrolase [Candidatus Nanoarchaeia archaeon]MDD5239725.1 metal-dependent hydrolase [Candidatus Nanoarchaeia archaeon]